MHNQVFSADHEGALQFAAKGMDGVLADVGRRGRQVDEIVAMNDERCKIVRGAFFCQQLNLQLVGSFGAPHARAGGKDLQGVGADFAGMDGGPFERACRAGMNADAHDASITCGMLAASQIGADRPG